MALIADGVSALFIDGKPCPGSAGTFPTSTRPPRKCWVSPPTPTPTT